MQQFISGQLQEHLALFQRIEHELAAPIARLAERLIDTLRIGNKLLIMGNGGSAADAQHFAGVDDVALVHQVWLVRGGFAVEGTNHRASHDNCVGIFCLFGGSGCGLLALRSYR